jgi:hypothetical protein
MLDSCPPPVNVDISDDLAAAFSDLEPDESAAVGAVHRTAGSDSAYNGPALRTGKDERSHVVFSCTTKSTPDVGWSAHRSEREGPPGRPVRADDPA